MNNSTELPQKQIENSGLTVDAPERATALFEKGFEPIPIVPGEKFPDIKNWPNIKLPITPWPKDHGIGLRTGSTIAIDIDILDYGIVKYLLGCLDFPHIVRIGQAPKALVPLLCPEITEKLISDSYVDSDGVLHRIEILSHGQQFVAHGIHPDTKKPYYWSGDLLSHSLPEVPLSFIEYLFETFYELSCAKGWKNISLKEKQVAKEVSKREPTNTSDKPGDLYNWAYSITDVLEEYGWKNYRGQYWTRPGKKRGVSGSVFDGTVFWCFTGSTCLEPDRLYDSFGLLTMYEFGGNFSASAKAIHQSIAEAA